MSTTQRRTPPQSNFPQLGGDAESYQPVSKSTGEGTTLPSGNAKISLKFAHPDMANRVQRRGALANMTHSLETASDSAVASGTLWYPKVNEAVSKGITGRGSRGFMSGAADKQLSGAGIVAAVSPNMDWDRANIGAFAELKGLKSHHWDAIMGGSRQQAADAVKGLSISSAPRGNLQKAGRIIQGEDPDTVIPQGTAPKTHAFMHNIADPANPHHVTIDGRMHDILTNRAKPWGFNRGLTSKSGDTTVYNRMSGVVQEAAAGFGVHPSAAQAISWEHTKYGIEQAGTTSKGTARTQGPARRGQAYVHPKTGEPVLHSGQFG